MAGGQITCAQDKRGALAISPTIVILVGKHGVINSSLILIPDVDFPVGIVSEAPLAPLVVLLPVFFLGGRCCIILLLGWIVIVVLRVRRAESWEACGLWTFNGDFTYL